jgi:peptidoglycan/xylan/chitin deacetylase (PgdA/CDA1 family)
MGRWLRSRFINGALILGYHRIEDTPQDPYAISVRPRHFAEQLEALSRYAHVMPLPDLVRALRNDSLPPRAVAVTFDDGYADNLYHAKPLLERYQVPATVFVATGQLGREFWWDELERVLFSPVTLPREFHVPMGGSVREWTLNDAAASPQRRGATRSRRHFLLTVHKLLMPLSPEERHRAIAELRIWAGFEPDSRPIHRCLTPEELHELTTGGLVDVGAHTVTHPALSGLTTAAQRMEIQQSKMHLETLLGQPVMSFSYPNGSASPQAVVNVRESGFNCACASHKDVVFQGTDPFCLPRFWMPDRDGGTISRWLTMWLGT